MNTCGTRSDSRDTLPAGNKMLQPPRKHHLCSAADHVTDAARLVSETHELLHHSAGRVNQGARDTGGGLVSHRKKQIDTLQKKDTSNRE